ncbi:hypothetical protein HYY75_11080 [bacterium]|nr:hypothetical protein [bacterium]
MKDNRIKNFEKKVVAINFLLFLVVMVVGFVGFERFLGGTAFGFLAGFLSFHMLVKSVEGLDVKTKRSMVGAIGFSGGKVLGLLFLIWLLFRFGVELTQVIMGLLLSQIAIFIASFSIAKSNSIQASQPTELRN